MTPAATRTPRLHAVTDDRILRRPDFTRIAQEVLRAGGPQLALHVRGPGAPGREIYERARELEPAAEQSGATLLANDRVDVSLVLGLEGVHLGGRSLPPREAREILGRGALVGSSVHGVGEARQADAGGADYLVVGTIYRSASHPERSPAGLERLREIGDASGLPLLAIGGVSPERVDEVLEAGAHGVAALSGVWDADRPGRAVRSYLRALEAG